MAPYLSPTVALAIAPLTAAAGGVKPALALARRIGYEAAQLSAAQAGIRPRDLDGRGRRDLLAELARQSLAPAGLDLFIPHEHWGSPQHQDRAVAAVLAALELAAEMGRIPLSTTLPTEAADDAMVGEIVSAADGRSTPIALHAESDPDGLAALLSRHDTPVLGVGVDPAGVLAGGGEPGGFVLRFADRLLAARLDDYRAASALRTPSRVALGSGSLDLDEYRAALAAANRLQVLIADPRDLADPAAGAGRALEVWREM